MLGLGEEKEEVLQSLRDLADNGCDVVTLGQYLQPTSRHLSVVRFVHPDEFAFYREEGYKMGLTMSKAARWCVPLTTAKNMLFLATESISGKKNKCKLRDNYDAIHSGP